MTAKKVIEAINRYSIFSISSHVGLEADALGSELALASLLKKMGKKAYVINSDLSAPSYSFLPGIKNICHDFGRRNIQAAFIIDCPSKQRIGRLAGLMDQALPIINIDHHLGNHNFGRVNWVDHKASSTGEMIYRLFRLTSKPLDKNDALNIYTAILTDTGSFRHANTTSAALEICSALLRFGIKPAQTYSLIYENNSVGEILTLGKLLSKLSFSEGNRIAWAKLNRSDFKRIGGRPEVLDRILDLSKTVATVKVVAVFCQNAQHSVKVSLRSKSPVNVQRIAKSFGGGGHRFASGCTIKGSLQYAERRMLRKIKTAL